MTAREEEGLAAVGLEARATVVEGLGAVGLAGMVREEEDSEVEGSVVVAKVEVGWAGTGLAAVG